MSAAEARGLLTVRRGAPTAEELAVLSAVLLAALSRTGDDADPADGADGTRHDRPRGAAWCRLTRASPPPAPGVRRPAGYGR
ncbi:acyl-CoA carboxylase epsilon subunit [Streptacidiphilus jiangxiensis]|uniref:acyl-CoA carboxylase epsilon subunit n=1 Tax=Streptacidiphilus jiangxiensis TaxID=235985 RepID=UPI0034E1B17F